MGSTATRTPMGTSSSASKLLPVPRPVPPRAGLFGQALGGAATQPARLSGLAAALLMGAAATPAHALPTAPPYAPPPSASFSGAGRWSNAPPPPNPPPPPPPRPAHNAPSAAAGPRPLSGTRRGKRGKERT